MNIGHATDLECPRFYVTINGKRKKPSGRNAEPYRFTRELAERETRCTELRNKVSSENIVIEPV